MRAAPTLEQHYTTLSLFLDRVLEVGMTLNPKKRTFQADEVKFWGTIVSTSGVSPDREKINALKNAPIPRNKDDVHSFSPMARSNGNFIPFIARRTPRLRDLATPITHFQWTPSHIHEFVLLRDALAKDDMRAFFDTELPVIVFVDAHIEGLEAVLMQPQFTNKVQREASDQPTHLHPIASRSTHKIEKIFFEGNF